MTVASDPVWTPDDEAVERANLTGFLDWLRRERDLDFTSYDEVWQWSVDRLEDFWEAIWQFYGLSSPTPYETPLVDREMPGARWFPGAQLNYAEEVLTRAPQAGAAIIVLGEDHVPCEVTAEELAGQVGALAMALAEMGVEQGDRVAAYLPNVPQAVVAMLATSSLGAVWSACAPDFGTQSVIDRFAQLEPKVLIAADGYCFGGREHDRRAVVQELRDALPSVTATVLVRLLHSDTEPLPGELGAASFDQLVTPPREARFVPVEFDHPLWILFSSGTTGIPKGIVQSHGGIVVEHLKSLGLGMDLRPGDRYLFFSSTSWMAWNYLVGGLLHGATIILYNGSPAYPTTDALWSLAAQSGTTVLGMGAAYVTSCQKAGVELDDRLGALRTVIPTGSPLPPGGWSWLTEQLPRRTRIDAICGGTDVCTAFLGGSPLLPVHAGEIACRWLGVHAQAWNDEGRPLIGEVGEFVITAPMPSMPVGLWRDEGGERYRESYFDVFPAVWRQGDWVKISERGSVVVEGRSDATLNRHGVRMGSAEIYGAVERLAQVQDSLVVGVELPGGAYYMPLFVVPAAGETVDDDLREAIVAIIRSRLSPRHLPDEIVGVPAVPRTLTGKKLELPVKRILQGKAADEAAALGAVEDPGVLAWYATFAERRRATWAGS
jgi:acetoacetyl-CoA synthetase